MFQGYIMAPTLCEFSERTARKDLTLTPRIRQILYLVIAETANSALDMTMMYELLIQQWGSPDATIYLPRRMLSLSLFIANGSNSSPQFFVQVRIGHEACKCVMLTQ